MAARLGYGLSVEQKTELWQRYRRGESCSEIGRALGTTSNGIRGIVVAHGGFSPPSRRRHSRVLSFSEREDISRGLSAKLSIRQIAARLGRAASSISREIRRHGGRGDYRALQADRGAWQRARRPKCGKLAQHRRLRVTVIDGLKQNWSPKQIAKRLPKLFPCDQSMRVSHETIYRSLFIQARGELKKQLVEHLRSGRVMRRARTATTVKVRDKSWGRYRSVNGQLRRKIEQFQVTGKEI